MGRIAPDDVVLTASSRMGFRDEGRRGLLNRRSAGPPWGEPRRGASYFLPTVTLLPAPLTVINAVLGVGPVQKRHRNTADQGARPATEVIRDRDKVAARATEGEQRTANVGERAAAHAQQ